MASRCNSDRMTARQSICREQKGRGGFCTRQAGDSPLHSQPTAVPLAAAPFFSVMEADTAPAAAEVNATHMVRVAGRGRALGTRPRLAVRARVATWPRGTTRPRALLGLTVAPQWVLPRDTVGKSTMWTVLKENAFFELLESKATSSYFWSGLLNVAKMTLHSKSSYQPSKYRIVIKNDVFHAIAVADERADIDGYWEWIEGEGSGAWERVRGSHRGRASENPPHLVQGGR